MSMLEETDGFVLVSKEGLGGPGGLEDDIVSVSSSRSSLCLVDDPSLEGLLEGEVDAEAAVSEPEPAEPGVEPADASGDAPAPEEPPQQAAPQLQDPPSVPHPADPPAQQAVPKTQPKYVCAGCRSDVAARADTIWEGYMGANKAAFLFSKVLNTEPAAAPRKQQLSTGVFLLQDVHCKTCAVPLGWSYLKSWTEDQKYKEGTTIVQQSLLQLIPEASP